MSSEDESRQLFSARVEELGSSITDIRNNAYTKPVLFVIVLLLLLRLG